MNNFTRHHVGTCPADDTGLRPLCGRTLGKRDGHIGVYDLDRLYRRDGAGACGDCLAILNPPRHRRELARGGDGNAIAALYEKLTGYVGGKRARWAA